MDVRVTIEENGKRYEPEPPLTKLEKIELIARCIFGAVAMVAIVVGMPMALVVYIAEKLYHPESLRFIWSSVLVSVASLPVLALIVFIVIISMRRFPRYFLVSAGGSMASGCLILLAPFVIGPAFYYVLLQIILLAGASYDLAGQLDQFTGSAASSGATLILTPFLYTYLTLALFFFWDYCLTKCFGEPIVEENLGDTVNQ